jgi:hypothetical protein
MYHPTLNIQQCSKHIHDSLYSGIETAVNRLWSSTPIQSSQKFIQLAIEYYNTYSNTTYPSFTECVLDIIMNIHGYDIHIAPDPLHSSHERRQQAANTYSFISRYCQIALSSFYDVNNIPMFIYNAKLRKTTNVYNTMMYELPVPELWEFYCLSCKISTIPVQIDITSFYVPEADPILYDYRSHFIETTAYSFYIESYTRLTGQKIE